MTCMQVAASVHSHAWTKCATAACLLANNTFCLFGSHSPVTTVTQARTYRYTDRPVLSNLISHLLSDRLMSSDTAGVDVSPWAVTVVTEDPAPGQAVTGSNPAASLVNVSAIRPDQDRFSYSLMGECAYTPAFQVHVRVWQKRATLFFHFSTSLCLTNQTKWTMNMWVCESVQLVTSSE